MFARRIDLNADVGEGASSDAELVPLLTSANVACGVHAGDEETMRATVELARRHGVAVGAHPSLPDRAGFGRREMQLPLADVEECVVSQVRALARILGEVRLRLQHVKPHGALYNMAARDMALARAIARAIAKVDLSLVLVGLSGSALLAAGRDAGLRTAAEVFADRAYAPDGTLVARADAGSVLHDPALVVPRAVAMVRDRAVTAIDGTRVPLAPDTLCVHGDTPAAAALAARIRQALVDAGLELVPLGAS